MKKLIAIAFTSVLAYTGNAQVTSDQSASANQLVNLELSNVLEFYFTSTGNNTGTPLNLQFQTINDYVNGVESTPQQLVVNSNKNFFIRVKANALTFSGPGSAPPMYVQSTLGLRVPTNNTGGSIDAPFSAGTYASITDYDQFLIGGGVAGLNKTFDVQYKATPGIAYPAGNYSIGIIYTATQF